MARIRSRFYPSLVASGAIAGLIGAAVPATAASYSIETVASGLEHPWGMAFLPDDDRMLVTERPGRLLLIDRRSGEKQEIEGAPEVDARGQGGLLDVLLHPRFTEDPWVYLTWAGRDDRGLTATYVGRGRLDLEAGELIDFEILFVAGPHVDSRAHYGSRLVFDADEHLFVTVGDRNFKNFGPEHPSQNPGNYIGTTLRLNADGSVPSDNPFVGDPNVRDAIFSYGHRNSQGMTIHPETGELWQNEHGENKGDEVNVIVAGGNFGWPLAHYGHRYGTGIPFATTPHEHPDTIPPVHWWPYEAPENFPPSGFVFYFGEAFPEWQGNALMGNLRHQFLGRFTVDGHDLELSERLLDGQGWRIRDVAVAPENGFVYVLVDARDAPMIRLVPNDERS
ncbi:MAG: PQQ-dependent sugar dehydrogenase [Geminicoccaceae bacterium]|nr:MAG: PQQ-dependent sugar dehydrogenase [Geminicoccaceae bacterium]